MNTTHDDAQFLALLERWREGDFTRHDEQTMQALTENDAFRQAAWAGYRAHPTEGHAALERLRNRLRAQQGPVRRSLRLYQLAAIAASIAVVTAAVWWLVAPPRKEAAIAAAKPAESTDREGFTVKSPSPEPPAAKTVPPPTTAPAPPKPIADNIPAPVSPVLPEPVAAEATSEVLKPMSREAARLPPIAARPKKAVGDTALALPDGVPGAPLGDVAQARSVELLKAEPVNGWAAFEAYLRESAHIPFAAINQNISGVVRLSFVVLPDGTPTQFVLKKPLGYGCDEEAIRLISAWQWLPGKDDTVTVEVWFRK
jgi:periplasmic protein TonB